MRTPLKSISLVVSTLILISLISVFRAGVASAQVTIDGEISVSEWGSPIWTITGSRANYNVYAATDNEALYLAFEYLGNDPEITSPTVFINVFIDGNNNDNIDGLDKAFIFQNRNGLGGVMNWLRMYPAKSDGSGWDIPPYFDDPNQFGYLWETSISPETVPVRIGISGDRKVVEWRIPRNLVGVTGNSFGLTWQAFDSYNWNHYNVTGPTPPAPSLVSPLNGENISDNTPTFEWTLSDPSGVTYQIQIDDNVDFSSPVYFAVDFAENAHTLPDENALALGTYFWHVRAKDGTGNVGDWSEEWNFTVVPIGAIGVLLMPLLMLLPFALILKRQNRRL